MGYSAIRRAAPIAAYVGPNGGGKTLAMVHDTLLDLDAGVPVLSTVKLLDPITGKAHHLWIPLVSWSQLLEAHDCVVLLDEVTGVASSRSFATLPHQLANMLVQLRKRNVVLRWSSPNYARADVIMREVTQVVTVCKGYLPKPDPASQWPQKRVFSWTTYDAIDYDELQVSKLEKIRPVCSSWFYRSKKKRAQYAYDTKEAVETLDHMDMTGMCLTCNGKRVQPKCSCDQPESKLRLAELAAETGAHELEGHQPTQGLNPALLIMESAPPKGGA